MTLLRVESLKKEYGATSIFQEVAFQLANGDRVGLVGANGTGKTTLLRCLAGKLQPDGGQVHRIGDRVVGYLEQTWTPPPGVTVWQAAASVLATVHEQESRLRHLEELMRQTSGDELERIIEAYAQAMHRFESLGGFQAEANLRAILFGLGLRESQLDQPASELSGGERIRLQLGRLLYENPHVLLLDEPTNHLDLPATEWLEQYLARYEGAIVLVSHDRAFLDAVCTKIFALENGTLSIYSGNFSQYVSQRQAELVLREKLRARQSEQQRQLERFIQKFGAGTRARQAKSRKKQLDRLKKETVPEPQSRERSERFHFHPTGRGARLILQIDRLVVRRQERVLFGPFTSEVQRGERVAIVGPNGSGKSTLLRVLLGAVQPTSGSFAWAQEMKIGYFAQHLDELNDELTILQELTGSADLTYEEARSLLARFNFRGDEVDKKVRSLSGGERNRLSLAKLVVSQCQVMMLDEPTNHLDVSGRQALEAALVEYPGTILFVSHDRYFIKQLADRIWSIEHETLREYGSYDEFVQRNRVLGSDGESQAAVAVFHGVQGRERVGRSDRSNPGREKRRQQQLRKKILEEREQLEDEIAVLEQRLNELNEQLSQPDVFRNEEGLQLSAEYEETEANLQRLYERWLLLEEEHPDGAD